jgi:hypothetical protein
VRSRELPPSFSQSSQLVPRVNFTHSEDPVQRHQHLHSQPVRIMSHQQSTPLAHPRSTPELTSSLLLAFRWNIATCFLSSRASSGCISGPSITTNRYTRWKKPNRALLWPHSVARRSALLCGSLSCPSSSPVQSRRTAAILQSVSPILPHPPAALLWPLPSLPPLLSPLLPARISDQSSFGK